MPTLREVVDLIHGWYPPETAEEWDAVGLVYGDPDAAVIKILLAVDPTPAVAAEAVGFGADLVLVHHPLFLEPVHGFAATTPKARTLMALAGADCALLTAHTNADQADGGVSQALADALGVSEQRPIRVTPTAGRDKLTVFVPRDAAAPLRAALAEAGAGRIGDYDFSSFTASGQGRFRPLEGADPAIGSVGEIALVEEERIEVVFDRDLRGQVLTALLGAHPYQEPAYDVVELADPGLATTGAGRIGVVEPTTLADFARTVSESLPATAAGIRVAGDPDRAVRTVAVCGGAGDFLLDEVRRLGADVYVTSDLRHHPAAESGEQAGPALIDVAHWAGESTWLPVVEARLSAALGDTVETRVSEIVTDPWSDHL